MIHPGNLLAHAASLVRSGDEADIRRAVSAAYYALFHALAMSGAAVFGSAGGTTTAKIARAFDHATMYRVCRTYVDPNLRRTSDTRLLTVAQAFMDLQDARVTADYDLPATFLPTEAGRLVDSCDRAMRIWPELAQTQQGQAFLAALLLGPRLNRRA